MFEIFPKILEGMCTNPFQMFSTNSPRNSSKDSHELHLETVTGMSTCFLLNILPGFHSGILRRIPKFLNYLWMTPRILQEIIL